jgi:hypothetical protein
MGRTVQIIGKAPTGVPSQARCGIERWGCNDLNFAVERWGWRFDAWDRWFDRHTPGHILKHRPVSWGWYATRGDDRPIYLLQSYPEIPGSVAYPTRRMQESFAWDSHPEELFTSSLDWMLALAIAERFQRIEIYGADMWDAPHERGDQRNGAHFWIGRALGAGIDVHLPDGSSLCKTERLYGCFTPTSGRNFSSISVHRFMAQWKAAQAMQQPGYVAPGVDEEVAHG